jgi:hypothetical protein
MNTADDAPGGEWEDAPVRCRAVIFDLDGTLLDTGAAHAATLQPRRAQQFR